MKCLLRIKQQSIFGKLDLNQHINDCKKSIEKPKKNYANSILQNCL